jgi:hypothetical protein
VVLKVTLESGGMFLTLPFHLVLPCAPFASLSLTFFGVGAGY